ncbi:hypothetical protein KIN20_018599 [Parelaphostrongylus tenuis]|uniref:Uncharacterized protein n=1 Tax=Parelaphostrongylus tenuis TaxID=148309 RepID=A0AAD5MN90_PARTN|nr:hypothetical protein KIN20_018599 [Parelaphostrongylus tenuis]
MELSMSIGIESDRTQRSMFVRIDGVTNDISSTASEWIIVEKQYDEWVITEGPWCQTPRRDEHRGTTRSNITKE